MAERDQRHRHHIERSNSLDQRLGLCLGFILIVFVTCVGPWLELTGRRATGTAALVASAGVPVTALIYRRRRQYAEGKGSKLPP